ncbi:MAG TPA: deoxyguanosinetriphosphate triphosphohydrolase [Terriglobia bacterium]|nr:deoxyguanosinetriphosphate triphosphohydrolase [Terriglobia bacterium]
MRDQPRQDLAPYAMPVERSLGRRYPEPPHPYRNAYERDRDRVTHSRAFRRLENKTQVFAHRYSDHFRTRLTHTLEVAQISRTVARALRLNADLVEALALVHDVGHPPFGHAGEAILGRLMARYHDRFDHNLHALRIVESFERKYAAFPGLNLTFEVREGIIKHSRDYDPELYPELSEYRLDEQPPLEAQLIDLTDEITYNSADLDDGYESGLLSVRAIRAGLPVFDRFYRQVGRQYPAAIEKLKFNEALKRLLDALVTNLIVTTRSRIKKLRLGSVDAVRAHGSRLVDLSPSSSRENQRLKRFLHRHLYSHENISAERRQIAKHVERLFDYFIAHPRRLPPAHFEKTRQDPVHRVVCDYIAGMTDNYLETQYQNYLGE